MRDMRHWLACIHCGHKVNPRSERCEVLHPLCTREGCELPRYLPETPGGEVRRDAALPPATFAPGTVYLFDIASYQAGINLPAVMAAGWDVANIKTSQGNWYAFGDALSYARAWHAMGGQVSTFHWIDNSASGRAQADYAWRTLGPVIAAVGPVVHIVDEEDTAAPASYQHLADYVARIRELMGHLPAMYTGDWYATSPGRAGWNVAALSPWLMSAPSAGYLGSYPGDQSPHWGAGYWGYGDLAAMQFAVSPIPGAGGGSISKTAIRDRGLWSQMMGGTEMVTSPEMDEIARRTAAAVANTPVGGAKRSAHYAWSDAADMANDGRSSYDGRVGWVPSMLNALAVSGAADETRDTATTAAVKELGATVGQLLALLQGGGGTADGAAIVAGVSAKIEAATQATGKQAQALLDELHAVHTELSTERAERQRLERVLATAGQSLAAADDTQGV